VLLAGACSKKQPPPKSASERKAELHRGGHFLTDREFATLSAICELILPRDQDVGALDLNVPQYVDRCIQTPEYKRVQIMLRRALFSIEKEFSAAHGSSFAQADTDAQNKFFTNWMANTERHGVLVHMIDLTLEGAFCDPSYGGNQGEAGWHFLGYEPDPCAKTRLVQVRKG
jgi:gluconate 2-dehydrogenase gamma chain